MNLMLSLFILGTPPVDKLAHVGLSWAINHSTYSICNKFTESEDACLIGSTVFTGVLGATKEILDKNNSNKEHVKDLMANGIGILGSSLFITLNW